MDELAYLDFVTGLVARAIGRRLGISPTGLAASVDSVCTGRFDRFNVLDFAHRVGSENSPVPVRR